MDMRTLAFALEAYYLDYEAYPPCAKGAQGVNAFLKPDDPAYSIYTFGTWSAKDGLGSFLFLTTPVAYITSLPKDPLARSRGASYGYYCQKSGWILFSCGPDGVYDLMEPEKVYDYHIAQPTLRLIAEFSYDPTNGAGSSGDVFRCKQ
ncbi:MAG: hypothetical protein NTX50_08675 [Candidatus Sumerlaeota bacterium]|nr:hypothetical protein [Candidatus Sumerlaeota bacterium]